MDSADVALFCCVALFRETASVSLKGKHYAPSIKVLNFTNKDDLAETDNNHTSKQTKLIKILVKRAKRHRKGLILCHKLWSVAAMVVSQTLECWNATLYLEKHDLWDSSMFQCFQVHAEQRMSLLIPTIVSGPKRCKGDSLAPPAPGCSNKHSR